MEVTSNKNPIADYFETHDTKYIAEDAVFINMDSGEKTIGRQAIGEMLYYIYHIAFDAHADIINTIITKDKAVLEANFVGKHIGEFAGISATQKNVEVPLCVTYDLDNDLIKRARIYMSSTIMMQQLNA